MKITLAPPVPCQWKEFLLKLRGDKPLQSAEMWINSHVTHCHGNTVSNQWKTLLQYLSDVVIISEGCTYIRQIKVFSTLSPWQQRNLLAVIYQHRTKVGMENLKFFIKEIEWKTDLMSWTGLIWKMLSNYVGIPQGKDSSDSKQLALPSEQDRPQMKDVETTVCSTDEINVITDAILQGEDKDLNVSGDFIVILDEEEEEDVLVSSPAKKVKLEDGGIESAELQEINKVLIDLGGELLDVLQSSVEDEDAVGEALEKIICLPTEKVEDVFKACGLSDMAESNLSTLCGVLVKKTDHVTFASCVALISGMLGHKLQSLQQTASRQLQGVVISLASTFPLQLLDAVLVPDFVQQLGAPQSEVLNHLCKECLSKQHQAHLLGRLVAWDTPLTESALTVVNAVVEVKPVLDDQQMTGVVNSLANSVDQFKDNLKFGKMLLSFINKYGSKWTRSQISTMNQISGRHRTFLKSKIDSVLKKL